MTGVAGQGPRNAPGRDADASVRPPRGLILVLASVALGGVAWLRFVLRAEPHVKPDGPTVLALRAVAVAAAGAGAAQAAVVLVSLGALASAHGGWPALWSRAHAHRRPVTAGGRS